MAFSVAAAVAAVLLLYSTCSVNGKSKGVNKVTMPS